MIEILFWASSVYILPLWAMMWFLPHHATTWKVMSNPYTSIAPLCLFYGLAVLPSLVDILLLFSTQMPTPSVVIDLFDDDTIRLVGWLHFLALDTLAGQLTWKRCVEHKISIKVSLPVLFLCMMVAPLGYLIGLLVIPSTNKQDIQTTH